MQASLRVNLGVVSSKDDRGIAEFLATIELMYASSDSDTRNVVEVSFMEDLVAAAEFARSAGNSMNQFRFERRCWRPVLVDEHSGPVGSHICDPVVSRWWIME